MKAKRKRHLFFLLAALLLIGGIYFTTTNAYKLLAGYTMYQWNKQVTKETEEVVATAQTEDINKKQADKVVYEQRPAIGELMGSLYIPKLDKTLPIIHGTHEDELAKGVGHYADSVLPGEKDNSVLSGHRDTVFRSLGEVGVGDELITTTTAGTFTFQVKKVRIVDFGDTLAGILKEARKEQLKNRMQYGELYHRNYYKEVHVKNRVYYEYYHLDGTQEVPADYKEIPFVCLRPDGSLELPSTLSIVCRSVSKKLEGFEDFHFHQLRHTYTSNLLSNGAAPKDVQELLGHSDVSTTMNIYAHSTRKAKRDSARLLDKVASNA